MRDTHNTHTWETSCTPAGARCQTREHADARPAQRGAASDMPAGRALGAAAADLRISYLRAPASPGQDPHQRQPSLSGVDGRGLGLIKMIVPSPQPDTQKLQILDWEGNHMNPILINARWRRSQLPNGRPSLNPIDLGKGWKLKSGKEREEVTPSVHVRLCNRLQDSCQPSAGRGSMLMTPSPTAKDVVKCTKPVMFGFKS